jgi:nicotinate-nucleotide pyrophosphorylase (carboxylating)
VLDKLAVQIGGGVNHRFGLDDMVLIKDNHIVAAGGVRAAIERCKVYLGATAIDAAIEVETRNLAEVREALQCSGVARIMLDNFPLSDMERAVKEVDRRVEVEASGGITMENIRDVAATGVDLISIGALTHSVKALDISLELTRIQRD